MLETPYPTTPLRQLGSGRLRTAAAVKQAINLAHDRPQDTHLRQAVRDPLQRPVFARGQFVLDKQMAMLEQALDAMTRWVYKLLGGARSERSALKYFRHSVQWCWE
jgi:hypothetical protein